MLSINDVLHERYQIIRQLGQGGMGAVYEAKDHKRFGKEVALKEILIALTKTPTSDQFKSINRAFEREAQILTQFEHEAFPQVIDYFSEADNQYLVMELIKGDELGELLKKQQTPFPIEDILNWADQLLDALDYIHSLNPPTIHRDIKPQNLKLTPRGKIKLLDFGIAKSEEINLKTAANQTIRAATVNYSPIEQSLRAMDASMQAILAYQHNEIIAKIEKQNADPRSDIYALGATLYHFATNQLPVDALKRSLEIWSGKPDPLPSPQFLNPGISSEISAWLLKAMQIDNNNRFKSANEMRQSLHKIISEADTININNQKAEIHEENPSSMKTEKLLNAGILINQSTTETPQEPEETTLYLSNLNPSSKITEILDNGQMLFTGEMPLPKRLPLAEESSVSEKPEISNINNKNFSSLNRKKSVPVLIVLLTICGIAVSYLITDSKSNSNPIGNSNPENSNVFINNALAANDKENNGITFNSQNNSANNSNLSESNKKKQTSLPVTSEKKKISPPKTGGSGNRNKSDSNCIFNDDCK